VKVAVLIVAVLAASPLFGQSDSLPAQRADSEEERAKILRAADQIEILQQTIDQQKTEIAQLRADLQSLRDSLAKIQETLAKSETARSKEREVLLAEVGKLVAAAPKNAAPEKPKADLPPSVENQSGEKGVWHIVEKGQTLWLIAQAYQAEGFSVNVADLRKANNLGAGDTLRVGQKLFIPKK
jgi:nucleoid-associated protein YgaU